MGIAISLMRQPCRVGESGSSFHMRAWSSNLHVASAAPTLGLNSAARLACMILACTRGASVTTSITMQQRTQQMTTHAACAWHLQGLQRQADGSATIEAELEQALVAVKAIAPSDVNALHRVRGASGAADE